MRAAVFLDRDGVLNQVRWDGDTPSSPRTLDELTIIPKAHHATGRLREAGFLLVTITNQPDIARGALRSDDAHELNAELGRRLGIDIAYLCPHDGSDGCQCRKPRPGMVLQAAAEWSIDLGASWLIGDRWVDLQAAVAAGVRPILLERPYSWNPTSWGSPPDSLRASPARSTLSECVDFIIEGGGSTPDKAGPLAGIDDAHRDRPSVVSE